MLGKQSLRDDVVVCILSAHEIIVLLDFCNRFVSVRMEKGKLK